jgi:hypothetical protein
MPELRVELILNSPGANGQFAFLESKKEEIGKLIELPLTWHNPDVSKSCKVYVRRDFDFRVKDNWEDGFKWLAKYLQVFSDTFQPMIRNL